MSYFATHFEDVFRLATSITASAPDPVYPAENLISEDPAKPAKLTTSDGNWVLGFDSKVAPAGVSLWHQYLDEGLSGVTIEGNDTDSWGAPSFSQTFTIPAKRFDGPTYQKWTIAPFMVLDPLPDPTGYLFWRLSITGTNSQPIAIGRLFGPSILHRVTAFFNPNIPQSDEQTGIEQETELFVNNFVVIGGPRRSMQCVLIGTDVNAGTAPVQEAADFRKLYESSEGMAHPFLWVPFEDNDGWPVKFETHTSPRTLEVDGSQIWEFAVRETSRGLPWP